MSAAVIAIREGVVIPMRAFPRLVTSSNEPTGLPVRGLHPLRRLAAHGLNFLLERGLVSATPGDDEVGHVAARIADRASMVLWRDVGCGELRLSVWWDLDLARHPQASGHSREPFTCASPFARRGCFPSFIGATVSCWVERRAGFWLQGKGSNSLFERYTRRSSRAALHAVPDPTPLGFKAEGRFFP